MNKKSDNNTTIPQSSELATELLPELITPALSKEINDMHEQGYDISIGNTVDQAYEHPEKIGEVFTMLDEGGKEFTRQSARIALAHPALRWALESPILTGQMRSARRRLRKRQERIREAVLYDQPDVQGLAWHHQNGKALALNTIVDASELRVDGTIEGTYDTISGRLEENLAEHVFGANSGWMEGKTLHETLEHVASDKAFKGLDEVPAKRFVDKEMTQLDDFLVAPVKEGFKDIVLYSTDSLGIRGRKDEVGQEIHRHALESDKDEYLMMSVGCGTALPMLEVMRDLKEMGKKVKLVLLDQDPVALAAAEQLAKQMGLEDDIEIHCRQLFVGKGAKTKVMDITEVLGDRKLDVGEDSGLREYFPDFLYKDLASQVWNALEDDGIMTTGNMNKNRPQPEFLHGLMGWPIPVKMRHIKDVARLHEQAGVPKKASRLRVTRDGVYTLCFSEKSKA